MMRTFGRSTGRSAGADRRLIPAIVTLILALVLPAAYGLPGGLVQDVGAEAAVGAEPSLACFAMDVVGYSQGPNTWGLPVSTVRSDPSQALGAPQRDDTHGQINFYSLGFGGHIVLEFAAFRGGPGVDISVAETSYGSPGCSVHPEWVRVEASQDGVQWFPTEPAIGCLDSEYDLGSLAWAKYLRLTDVSDPEDEAFIGTHDGFDVDGVAVPCPVPFTVSGVKWHDLDADGLRDAGEPGVGAVEIQLLRADPQEQPTPLMTATTAPQSGAYTFTVDDVPPATVSLIVREVVPDGWRAVTPSEVHLTGEPGGEAQVDFGNLQLVPGLALDKAGPDGLAQMGDTLAYTLTATNTGNVALSNVVVRDDLLALNRTIGALELGTSAVVTATLDVTEALLPTDLPPDAKSFTVTNTASADSDQVGPVGDSWDVEVEFDFQAPRAELDLEKTGPASASIGEEVTYTLRVTNVGDVPLTNVRVLDDKIAVDEVVATLAVGESRTFTGGYTVSEADLPGPLTNTATATSEESLPAEDSWEVAIETAPALSIDKVGPTGPVEVGDTIAYTITVRNTGDVTLSDVHVVDALLGLNETVASLAPGASRQFAADYTVGAADAEDDQILRNTATASSPLTGEVQATWSVPVSEVVIVTPTPSPTATTPAPPTPAPTETPEPCIRSDVVVIIFGGWDGIPVRAWVGGTEQPQRSTARNAEGEAQAMWTFYPPEGERWIVRVAAELPAGLDAERWAIKALDATSVTIGRCEQRVIRMQLIDKGVPTPVPQPPVLPTSGSIDSSVAARVAGWLGLAGLAGVLARRRVRTRR